MTMTIKTDAHKATIKTDCDGEFVVTFYKRDVYKFNAWSMIVDAEYYTDDKEDAIGTAHAEINRMES
jgi:hypothetical protein